MSHTTNNVCSAGRILEQNMSLAANIPYILVNDEKLFVFVDNLPLCLRKYFVKDACIKITVKMNESEAGDYAFICNVISMNSSSLGVWCIR